MYLLLGINIYKNSIGDFELYKKMAIDILLNKNERRSQPESNKSYQSSMEFDN